MCVGRFGRAVVLRTQLVRLLFLPAAEDAVSNLQPATCPESIRVLVLVHVLIVVCGAPGAQTSLHMLR